MLSALPTRATAWGQAGRWTITSALSALDFKALAAFWQSDTGRKICANAGHVKRELPFTARFTARELEALSFKVQEEGMDEEFVLVQGVADLVVILKDEIWLLDFKTDNVNSKELEAKRKQYEPQLKLYSLALSRIYGRPVTNCWLHFLSCNKTVSLG